MDGGDEDEHDEGAHQVGLEHLVPHLGVLHRQREEEEQREREGGGRRRGEDGETGVQTDEEDRTR